MSDVQPRRPGDAGDDTSDATTWLPAEFPPELALPPIDGAITLDDDLAALRTARADAEAEPEPAAEPDDGLPADAEPEPAADVPADVLPADPRIPTEEEMRRALSEPRPTGKRKKAGERDWRGPLVAAVGTLLAIFGPVQVVTGGNPVWLVAFAAGGALVIVGGPDVIRSAVSRGAAPIGPLTCVVAGVIVVVACAVVIGVSAQQFTTRPEPIPTVDVSAP